jgi:uncharacterized GH25 family protein
MPKILAPLVIYLVGSSPALGHELWIEPHDYQVNSDEMIVAEIKNGQLFEGNSLPYATRSIVSLEVSLGDRRQAIEGELGARPAIQMDPLGSGLVVIGYQTKASFLKYTEWQKFQDFADHKDFPDALKKHLARGFTHDEVREGYTRFSKTLVASGSSDGTDYPFGFEAEIVALDNPYVSQDDEISVVLNYQGSPLPDHQIEIFERAPAGTVNVAYTRTDGKGVAAFEAKKGHEYMLDAVIFREPSAELSQRMDVQWETLWANLTFARPE